MNFESNKNYQLKLNLHSKVMLAFRYGIAVEDSTLDGLFQCYLRPSKNYPNRNHCLFKILGEKVSAIMQDDNVITVLPLLNSLQTSDAARIALTFDISLSMSPTIFSMQEISDWREKYLESNGYLNKDDLRREIKKRNPEQFNPFKTLGLEDSFFEEVKELRKFVADQSMRAQLLTVGQEDHEKIVKEWTRAETLAKNNLTEFWEETEDAINYLREEFENYANSEEGKADGFVQVQNEDGSVSWHMNFEEYDPFYEEWLSRLSIGKTENKKQLEDPVIGVPSDGKKIGSFENKTIFYHDDCKITDIYINPRTDGWHEIHYENTLERFITTTKYRSIVESYTVGETGIWIISYDEGKQNYLQPFGGSKEKSAYFYYSKEWLQLRFQVLKNSDGKCALCGSNERLEVDHIKPRSSHPKLELEIENLQVLCHRCNKGKTNFL